MRILAAEDNALTRLDLRAILEGAGHDVSEARDGVEAVELARSTRPDVAILDVLMPRLDGIEAGRRIVGEREIPIVVLSGGAADVDGRATAAGIRGSFLPKPYSEQAVLDAVEAAVVRRGRGLWKPPHLRRDHRSLRRAQALYRKHAPIYEWESALFMPYRRRLVELLALERGETVLDAGCGTGLCFPAIQERIGPEGRLVGFDASREMLAVAEARAQANGWRNVTLAASPAAEASVDCPPADAVLFSFTHDILQSPGALANVFRHARDGARVAAVGPRWAPWWASWLNVVLALQLKAYVTTLGGLDRPWRHLRELVPDLEVEDAGLGVIYFAWGRLGRRRDRTRA